MQYQFCPKCAASLQEITEEDHKRLKCPNCGFIFYQNSKACSAGVIIEDGKVLLGKRKREPQQGMWNIPGGFLESDEHPLDGLHREIREELGVEIEVGDFLGFFMDKYGPENYDTLNIAWICKIKSGTPKAADDVEELKWFALNDLPKNLAFKNDVEILKALREKIS